MCAEDCETVTFSMSNALPQFFVYVEPLATIAGSVYAWTMPELYYRNLLPSSSLLERLTHAGPPQAGVMAIRQLGNCETSCPSGCHIAH